MSLSKAYEGRNLRSKNALVIFIMRVSVVYTVLLVGTLQLLLAESGLSQDLDEIKVTVSLQHGSLSRLVRDIESQTQLRFAYDPSLLEPFTDITLSNETRSVKQTLDLAFYGTALSYRKLNGSILIFKDVEALTKTDPTASGLHYVSGKVTDSKGGALPGVNILIRGTAEGTVTDAEGKYSLQVNESDILLFTFIGFKRVETEAGERTIIDVTLEEESAALNEVVINAGYYDVKATEMTGSISKVGADVISKQPVTNPLAAIMGRVPGAFVQQTTGVPGGGFNIQIRGRNSLRDDGNNPLYIVDGVPFSMDKVSSSWTTNGIINGGVSPLTGINAADIESIEVLKDADATAIYGSRGANGVVLITTKKGKAGKTKIDINYYSGFSTVKLQKLLNTQQYLSVRREAFRNDHITPTANPNDSDGKNGLGYAPDLMVWDTTRYTDWQKIFLGSTAKTNSLQASVSAGTENTQFLMGAGYYKETTVFPGDFGFTKLSSHLSLNHTSSDKRFFVNVSVNGSLDRHHQPGGDFTWPATMLAPNAPPIYNADGSLNWAPHPVTGQSTWLNPMSPIVNTYEGKNHTLITNATLGYKILDGLKFQTKIGFSRIGMNELTLTPSTRFDPSLGIGPEQSVVIGSNGSTESLIVEPQLNYDLKISEGKLSLLAGGTYQDQNNTLLANQYYNFSSNALIRDFSSAASRVTLQYVQSEYKYAAVFGRVNYNWDGKYIVNLTGRRDGSSRFGPERQYANFGAIGAAWIFSNESFIKSAIRALSFGKLRGSYGITGSDQIGNYQFLDTYESPGIANPYGNMPPALDPTRLYNPAFGWESNVKLEGAIELGFLNDRITTSVGYYRNRSSNQLVTYTLPTSTGFNGILANLDATVQNTGLEIELTTVNIQRGSFKWTTSMNVTAPRNKLISFPNLDSSTYVNRYVVGQSIYVQKFYKYTGVNPETGLYTVKDFNGDGTISRPADAQQVMFVGQDFYGGINNSITYMGWSLDFFLQVVKQTGLLNKFPYGYESRNFPASELDENRWRKPGDKADLMRFATDYSQGIGVAYYGSPHYNWNESDATVVDASFIRVKTVSLSYQFAQNLLKGVSNCTAYVRGQNLFVITSYQGKDPETQGNNLTPLRTFTVGLNLTF